MNFLLPLVFGIVNRIRGSDLKFLDIKVYSFVKNIFPAFLSLIIILNIDFTSTEETMLNFIKYFMLCFLAYRFGESMGWGKWIGSITTRTPNYEDDEGKNVGIHWIANLFIKEKKDYLNFSRLALAIRGFYWWFPVLVVYLSAGLITIRNVILASLILGICFPLSVEIGRSFTFKITSLIQSDWEVAEFIYGLMQGIVFLFLFF